MKFVILLIFVTVCQAVLTPKQIARAVPLPLFGVGLMAKRKEIADACQQYKPQATAPSSSDKSSRTTPPPHDALMYLQASFRMACALATH